MRTRMDEHDNRNADHAGEPAIRDLWLVKVSVSLALLLEVIPLEIEVVHISLVTGGIRYALAAKAIFLTLILLPLFIYVARNRLRTLGRERGRVAVIFLVVVAKLAFDLLSWARV